MFGFKIIKVKGHSMEPAIPAGSFVLVSTWQRNIKVGDVIYFQLAGYPPMIKRVTNINEGFVTVAGDNTNDSLDSMTFGEIKKDQIIGKVIWS